MLYCVMRPADSDGLRPSPVLEAFDWCAGITFQSLTRPGNKFVKECVGRAITRHSKGAELHAKDKFDPTSGLRNKASRLHTQNIHPHACVPAATCIGQPCSSPGSTACVDCSMPHCLLRP